MNKPKSILKYKPENNVNNTAAINKPRPTSWLSRLQSKIYSQQNNQDDCDGDNPLLIAKQDLKRVTFSVGNLITEHPFCSDDTPIDETFQEQKKQNTTTPKHITDLESYYEHACVQREEPCLDRLRKILKSNRESQLSSIDLSRQAITSSQANPISDILMLNFGLRELNLSNCKLDDEALRILLCSLLVSNTIEQLNLSNNNFKSKGFKYIAIFIKASKTLQSIELSDCIIEKKGMEYFSQGLKYAKSLTKLTMDHCILRPAVETLDTFSEGIYASNSLKSLSFCYNFPTLLNQELWLSNIAHSRIMDLNLSGNNLGSVLSSFSLKDNNTLQHLVLSNCKISSEGLSMLSNSLLQNTRLESLDLSRNPLCVGSDEGILSLKTTLSRNSNIESLNLSETQLDSGAVIALAEALPENMSLTRLDLSKNPMIDTAGVLALSISIKMNHTLTFLDINIPPSDEELANLQNDIVAVCTTNMLQKVEAQKQFEQKLLQQQQSDFTQSNGNLIVSSV